MTALAPATGVLSAAQQRIWLLEQLQPSTPLHHVAVLTQQTGMLDTRRMQAAVDELLRRHEVLRTSVRSGIAGPTLHDVADLRVDLQLVSNADSTDLADVVEPLVREPFDLGTGPLLRVAAIQRGENAFALLLVAHGLVADRRSAQLLIEDLMALYDGRAATRPAPPFAELAAREQSALAAGELQRELAYWQGELADTHTLLDLPLDAPRPPVQSFRTHHEEHVVVPRLGERIEALASRLAVDARSVVVTAIATLLARYSGQRDLVIGLALRSEGENAFAIGPLTNALPLRVEIDPETSFESCVAQVSRRVASAEEHSRLPFERLLDGVAVERDLSRAPVFQVLVDVDFGPLEQAGTQSMNVVSNGMSVYDLTFSLRRGGGVLRLELDAAAELFTHETRHRMLSHLRTLLESAVAEPSCAVGDLELLTTAERTQLLEEWNDTARPYPHEACLHELVAQQATARPDVVAVASDGQELTYRELEERANRLAHHLVALGVSDENVVGICCRRSCDLVVAMLGVLKTGAAYVPIDPSYPQERQSFILRDAAAAALITEADVARVDGTIPTVFLDRDSDQINARSATPPALRRDSRRLAYVIYTSGSTGEPKGVEIEHRSVVNLLSHMRLEPGLLEDDVVLNVTTSAFDLSVPDFYLPLVCGARLVIASPDVAADGHRLAAQLEESEATFMQATPTTWRMLVDAGWRGSRRLKVVCGGEPLPSSLVPELVNRGASLWHMYGPTETTVWSSILRLVAADGPPRIGGPIANTRFYVLDGRGQPVPVGVAGELHIAGHGVARGYRGRDSLTGERFVRAPFGAAADQRMYRTGDLVRYRDDGTLEFLGRLDEQVKLRGFRIELGEVETTLVAHPGVREAVAVVREDTPGNRRLVVYFIPAPPHVAVPELRRHLQERLPPYMLPSAFVELDAMPTTRNRKVDRSALPPPSGERPELAHVYRAPRTPVEELLVTTWEGVLGIDRVGIDDNFFELGGNSLLATQVVARLDDQIGLPVPLRWMFERPTIAGMAPFVVRALAEAAAPDAEIVQLLADLDGASATEEEVGAIAEVRR